MKWLENKLVSGFQIHSARESGYWVPVEARARLNTRGKSGGINQLWIDGRLECERRDLDFRGRLQAPELMLYCWKPIGTKVLPSHNPLGTTTW